MADLTMCSGYDFIDDTIIQCERKDKCYRHTATQNEYRQSRFVNIPLVIVDGKQQCDHFGPNGNKSK